MGQEKKGGGEKTYNSPSHWLLAKKPETKSWLFNRLKKDSTLIGLLRRVISISCGLRKVVVGITYG